MEAQAATTIPVEAPIDLVPRRLPVQDRAKERVERVLDTMAAILVETGFDGISTNLIAERANIDVASIYQYFPNKYAILRALAERTFAQNRSYIEAYDSCIPAEEDWSTALTGQTKYLVNGIRADPTNIALRRAIRARPEFCAIEKRGNELLAKTFADIFRRRGIPVDDESLRRMSRVLVETGMAILDVVSTGNVPDPDAYVDEIKTMHLAYVKRCIEKSTISNTAQA